MLSREYQPNVLLIMVNDYALNIESKLEEGFITSMASWVFGKTPWTEAWRRAKESWSLNPYAASQQTSRALTHSIIGASGEQKIRAGIQKLGSVATDTSKGVLKQVGAGLATQILSPFSKSAYIAKEKFLGQTAQTHILCSRMMGAYKANRRIANDTSKPDSERKLAAQRMQEFLKLGQSQNCPNFANL